LILAKTLFVYTFVSYICPTQISRTKKRELVVGVTKYMLKMSSTINLRLSGCLFWRCPKSEHAFTLNLQFLAYVFSRVQCSWTHGGSEANADTNPC